MTMTLISTTTVGSGGAANITFSSIPQTATDLYIVVSGRSERNLAFDNIQIRPNNSTTNGSYRRLYGTGSATGSDVNSGSTIIGGYISDASNTANTFGSVSIYIPNYAGSTYKSISSDSVSENNATAARQALAASLWSDTAAITSIVLLLPESGNNFAQYTTASLYGITKGSGGATVS